MRGTRQAPPFKLPPEVTDKHELTWWRILVDVDFRVVKRRAVFHVFAKWEDFRTDDTPGGRGADLDLQWALYDGDNGRCVGRASAWNCWMNNDWSLCFANEREALIEAAKLANQAAEAHRQQVAKYERIASAYTSNTDPKASLLEFRRDGRLARVDIHWSDKRDTVATPADIVDALLANPEACKLVLASLANDELKKLGRTP